MVVLPKIQKLKFSILGAFSSCCTFAFLLNFQCVHNCLFIECSIYSPSSQIKVSIFYTSILALDNFNSFFLFIRFTYTSNCKTIFKYIICIFYKTMFPKENFQKMFFFVNKYYETQKILPKH